MGSGSFAHQAGWPRGRRAYAIGDIHGCRDKLVALHSLIAADLAARPSRSAVLVHLGDYIDQGPDSAGVVSLLAAAPPVPGLQVVNLLGDHERMLLDALAGDRAAATDWLWAGGKDALTTWGLAPDLPREQWEAALPEPHVAWLRSLRAMHREGDYLFVHAGIRPGVPLEDQSTDDLLTIRQPFLSSEVDLGLIVVHGHSSLPSAQTRYQPDRARHRGRDRRQADLRRAGGRSGRIAGGVTSSFLVTLVTGEWHQPDHVAAARKGYQD